MHLEPPEGSSHQDAWTPELEDQVLNAIDHVPLEEATAELGQMTPLVFDRAVALLLEGWHGTTGELITAAGSEDEDWTADAAAPRSL